MSNNNTNRLLEDDAPVTMSVEAFLSGAEPESAEDLKLGQISLRFPERLLKLARKTAIKKNMMYSEYLRRLMILGMKADGLVVEE